MENITTLVQAEEAYTRASVVCNDAIAKGDLNAYGDARNELDKCVSQYNTLAERAAYGICLAAEKPFVQLATMFFFNGVKVTEEKEKDADGKSTGKLLSVSVDSVQKRMNIAKFIKDNNLNKGILNNIQKLYDLLMIREKNVLAMTPVEFKAEYSKGSDFTKSVYDALKKGGTPTSNTQIAQKLQEIINDCGIEKRVVGHDMHFLQQSTFNHDQKNKSALKAVTASKFSSFILDILAFHVTGKQYSLTEKDAKK